MVEQQKMMLESFGQQLQQQMHILQWLAGRLGGVEEVTLPENLHLPITSLDDLRTLEEQLQSTETRSTVVCMFLSMW